MSRLFWGFSLIVIGLWWWLSNMGYLNFERDWPVILIAIGIYELIKGISVRSRDSEAKNQTGETKNAN